MAPTKLSELKKLYEDRWNYPPAVKPQKINIIACGKSPNYESKTTYEPCWKSPKGLKNEAKFGPCWDYSPERYKRYPLPPPCRGTTIPDHLLAPKFDQCKAQYSRYDFKLEHSAHTQILIVEELLKNAEVRLAAAREFQMQKTKSLLYQAIRRRLLIGSACGIKIYPEYLSQMAEQRSRCEFQKGLNAINESNAELADVVGVVRDAMPELCKRLDKLDYTLDSPFLLELQTVLQTIQDLYDYFFEVVRKLKTWAQLLDVGQEHCVEDYLVLLQTDNDFESFRLAGTEHCTCKRCRNENPLDRYLPCWCQGKKTIENNTNLSKYLSDKKYGNILDSSGSGIHDVHTTTSAVLTESEKLSDN